MPGEGLDSIIGEHIGPPSAARHLTIDGIAELITDEEASPGAVGARRRKVANATPAREERGWMDERSA